jgi:dienelactone hydrolase
MDKIMQPSSWLTTILYKPVYAIQTMFYAIPWKMQNPPSVSQPRVFSFFQALRTSPPPFPTENLKIGAAGFCWGGKYTVLLAHNTPSSRVQRHIEGSSSGAPGALIDCGYTAHPSYLTVPDDIDAVTLPLSIVVGDNDQALKGPLALQTKEILEKKKAGNYEVNILPGAKHGFAIRTNPEDQLQMECAEKAELQAIAWFERWLA